jgi:Icc-related predicted phosphoesterase
MIFNEKKVRIVAISDTHGKHSHLGKLPYGDILIHAGDFSLGDNFIDYINFFDWLAAQPHKHKIVIAGNHDVLMEKANLSDVASMIPSGVVYLNDSGYEAEGIKFWGSPVQPRFYDWAFNRDRGEDIQRHWNLIPEGTDVLITHGPAKFRQDETFDVADSGRIVNVGCENLAQTIKKINPILHVCGHVHRGRGHCFNTRTTFVNASVCDENYAVANKPYVIDIVGKAVSFITY